MECRWGVSQSGEIGEMGSTRPRSRGERWVRDDVRGTLGRDVIVTDQYTPRTTHDRFIHSSSASVNPRTGHGGCTVHGARCGRVDRRADSDVRSARGGASTATTVRAARSRGTEARQAEAGAAEAANCGGPRGATSRIL